MNAMASSTQADWAEVWWGFGVGCAGGVFGVVGSWGKSGMVWLGGVWVCDARRAVKWAMPATSGGTGRSEH